MEKKDKASKDMKKEFKKQMDLTKNIGEEPKPEVKKPAAKKAVKAVKAEAPKQEEKAQEKKPEINKLISKKPTLSAVKHEKPAAKTEKP